MEHKTYSGNNFCTCAKFSDLYSLLHQKYLSSATGKVWKGNHIYTYININNNNNNNNNLLTNMNLGHLLTHSSLTHLVVSLMVSPGFFCLLAYRFLVFDYRTFCIYFANSFFCIPVFCPKLGFYLVLL